MVVVNVARAVRLVMDVKPRLSRIEEDTVKQTKKSIFTVVL